MWKKSSKSNLTTLLSVKLWKNTNNANYWINTTNFDFGFSRIKLLLTLVELKWEKVIILRLLLTSQTWRVVLVCPNSISVSVIINYTTMAATSHNFFLESPSFVRCAWSVYRSTPITRNLSCRKKFRVARL